jgi:hypothetical protein
MESSETRKVKFASPDDAFSTEALSTPSLNREMKYREPGKREADAVAPESSLSRPNYEDILRRVAVVIHQHVVKCEDRFTRANPDTYETGMFHMTKTHEFSEEHFLTPQYVYHFVRAPVTRLGFCYGVREKEYIYAIPDLTEVHEFLVTLFVKAELSAESSIVCLIYIERLMEVGKVPLLGRTWRPLLLCGLLLASKVWQDYGSWNSEFAEVYPQFTVAAINRLERLFCINIGWELYIPSSQYAKYYFALRSLTATKDFRRKYTVMMTSAPRALEIEKRSEDLKDEYLGTLLSRSL